MRNTDIHVRLARCADYEAMYAIYCPYVYETAVSFETTEPGLGDFVERVEKLTQRYPCLVAIEDGQIIGYAYANTFNIRAAYDWSAEATIYLKRSCRRRGAGRKLYTVLEEMLRAQGICNLNACIGVPRADDDPYLSRDSVNFHARMGFRMVGQFDCSGSKFGRWYDMAWMEKRIAHPTTPPPRVKWFPEIRDQFPDYIS